MNGFTDSMSKNISLVFEAVISVFNFTAEEAEEWLDENSHLIDLNKVTDFNSAVEQIEQL